MAFITDKEELKPGLIIFRRGDVALLVVEGVAQDDDVVGADAIFDLVGHGERIPDIVVSCSARFSLSLPDDEEIEQIMRAALRARHQYAPVQVDLTKGDLRTMIQHMRGLTRRQVRQLVSELVADDSDIVNDATVSREWNTPDASASAASST